MNTPTTLSVSDRLDAITAEGWPIAFDGCHKLYFLQDEGREAQARDFGYDIHPASDLRRLYENESCFLRFVSRWGYDNDDFDHPLNIRQGEDDDAEDEPEDEGEWS